MSGLTSLQLCANDVHELAERGWSAGRGERSGWDKCWGVGWSEDDSGLRLLSVRP